MTHQNSSDWKSVAIQIAVVLHGLVGRKLSQSQAWDEIECLTERIGNEQIKEYIVAMIAEVDGFPSKFQDLISMLDAGIEKEEFLRLIEDGE